MFKHYGTIFDVCEGLPKIKNKSKKKKKNEKVPELFVAEAICATLKCRVNRYSDL